MLRLLSDHLHSSHLGLIHATFVVGGNVWRIRIDRLSRIGSFCLPSFRDKVYWGKKMQLELRTLCLGRHFALYLKKSRNLIIFTKFSQD